MLETFVILGVSINIHNSFMTNNHGHKLSSKTKYYEMGRYQTHPQLKPQMDYAGIIIKISS